MDVVVWRWQPAGLKQDTLGCDERTFEQIRQERCVKATDNYADSRRHWFLFFDER
jgi:hypothetical protein